MPRVSYSTLYEDPKIKITYHPNDTPANVLHALDYKGDWHHYSLKEGALARLASVSEDPCEVRRVLDLQCKHILTYLIGIRTNATAFAEIARKAYHKQQSVMARAKKKKAG